MHFRTGAFGQRRSVSNGHPQAGIANPLLSSHWVSVSVLDDTDIVAAIRRIAPELTLGVRLSANDYEPDGLDENAIVEVCQALEADDLITHGDS